MRGRDRFAKFKPVIRLIVGFYGMFPRKLRERALERARKQTGTVALVRRYALLKSLAKRCGDNVSVFPDVHFRNVGQLEIGDNVSFQPMVYIEAYGGVKIGSDVSLAEGASMFSVTHTFADPDTPIRDQPLEPLPIEIGDNVWIGSKATILGGVTVARGSVVAAGAVVNRSFPENTVLGGVPAKVLKERNAK